MNKVDYEKAVASGRKLIIVGGNRVCDVTKFIGLHPGGDALINSYIGKDPISTKKMMDTRHTHTKAARNLMDTLTVAFYKE